MGAVPVSALDADSGPGAGGLGSRLSSLSHGVGGAGLPQEAMPNPVPPPLCCVPGRLVGLLVSLDPRVGRSPSDRQSVAPLVELVDCRQHCLSQSLGRAAPIVLDSRNCRLEVRKDGVGAPRLSPLCSPPRQPKDQRSNRYPIRLILYSDFQYTLHAPMFYRFGIGADGNRGSYRGGGNCHDVGLAMSMTAPTGTP